MLLEIKRLIDVEKDMPSSLEQFEAEVKRLSDEFYAHLPHIKHSDLIDNKWLIAKKQQLCQVLVNII